MNPILLVAIATGLIYLLLRYIGFKRDQAAVEEYVRMRREDIRRETAELTKQIKQGADEARRKSDEAYNNYRRDYGTSDTPKPGSGTGDAAE